MPDEASKQYYEAFAFGDSPALADELLALVLAGRKTATISVLLENEPAPKVGDMSLVLNGRGEPACEIRTVRAETVPYGELTWDMVKLEGEEDTFEEWLESSRRYWMRDAARRGYAFNDRTPVCFECFEVTQVF